MPSKCRLFCSQQKLGLFLYSECFEVGVILDTKVVTNYNSFFVHRDILFISVVLTDAVCSPSKSQYFAGVYTRKKNP